MAYGKISKKQLEILEYIKSEILRTVVRKIRSHIVEERYMR